MDKQLEAFNHLKATCAAAGATLTQKAPGHYHIQGEMLVNYYPFSARRTAYLSGTTQGRPATIEEAVAMAFKAPPRAEVKDDRPNNSRKIRKRLMRGAATVPCRWCGCHITLDTSTLEHVVPLALGGLDNDNNRTLACAPCNHSRGNTMPELDTSSTYTIHGRLVDEAEFRAHTATMPKVPGIPWKE